MIKNPEAKTAKSKKGSMIAGIAIRILIYSCIILLSCPFVFRDTNAESDPYSMALGIAWHTTTGTSGGWYYGAEFSFLFYFFYELIIKLFSISPKYIMMLLNFGSYVFGLLTLLAFELLLRAIYKRKESLYFVLMLFLMPIFWYVMLYAHPITPSSLFTLVSLLVFMKFLSADKPVSESLFFTASLVLYLVALSFRQDAIFLGLLFPASMCVLKKESLKNMLLSCLFLALAVVIYSFVRYAVTGISGYGKNLADLLFYSDFTYWRDSLQNMGRSVGLGGIIVFAASFFVVIAKKQWRSMLFPMSGILSIVIVWFGNRFYERRFYHLSFLIVILAYLAFESIKSNKNKTRFVAACVSVLFLFNIAAPYLIREANASYDIKKWRFCRKVLLPYSDDIYKTYAERKVHEDNLRKTSLELLAKFDKPVIVLGTWRQVNAAGYYLVSNQAVSSRTQSEYFKGHECKTFRLKNGNEIIFCYREFGEKDVLNLIIGEKGKYKGFYLLLLARDGKENLADLAETFSMLPTN